MPYQQKGGLPAESASKLGHLKVIESDWVKSLIEDFEYSNSQQQDENSTTWTSFDVNSSKPLSRIFAVDGSCVSVSSESYPIKEIAFVKNGINVR